MDIETYRAHGLEHSLWDLEPGLEVNGRRNGEIVNSITTAEDQQYSPCPEAGSPSRLAAGKVVHFQDWTSERVYPGTIRDVWIYLPSHEDRPPGVAVFQDGYGYLDPAGPVRATAVLETLISTGRIPPLAAVFVSPGRFNDSPVGSLKNQQQRSIEYDTCNDTYLTFLQEEILPVVTQQVGSLSEDPAHRLIAGCSSGGICAFNAAWHDPSAFGLVLSHCGSFTNIRGGHNYPYLVRTNEARPIKVLLQSGARDADILYGNWPLANQQMAAALRFAGYQVRFEFGEGGHSLRHGGSLFAESLEWLFHGA